MAKSNTISLRNFKQLDAILASSFRKRDAGKLLYQSVNDGAKVVRKAIRQSTPVSSAPKNKPAAPRKSQPKGTLRRSVKSGLRRKGYGKNPNLFAAAVFTNKDFTYSNSDGWYAAIVNKQDGNKGFFRAGFNAAKQSAELQIKFGIYKRVKQLQQKINMLR